MDIEHFTHRGYSVSLIVAVVLSAMVVTLASLLGRGTLNLRGALVQEGEPRPTAVIVLVEPKLQPGVTISEIDLLRKELLPTAEAAETDDPHAKEYSYSVALSDGAFYLVKIVFDPAEAHWVLQTFEKLHPGTSRESRPDNE